MREDYGNINLESTADDDFGDMPMDDSNSELRGGSVAREASLFHDEEPSIQAGPSGIEPSSKKSLDLEPPPMDDGFGSGLGGGDFGDSGGDDGGGGGGLFDEPVMAEVSNTIPDVRFYFSIILSKIHILKINYSK